MRYGLRGDRNAMRAFFDRRPRLLGIALNGCAQAVMSRFGRSLMIFRGV
jgi:hypothetical protein